jgi:hypothetical protein
MHVTVREFLNGIVKIRVKSGKNIGHFTANTYTHFSRIWEVHGA